MDLCRGKLWRRHGIQKCVCERADAASQAQAAANMETPCPQTAADVMGDGPIATVKVEFVSS